MIWKRRQVALLSRSLVVLLTAAACTDPNPPTAPSRVAVSTRPNLSAASEVALQVAATGASACALKADYNIVCWSRSISEPNLLEGAPFVAVNGTPGGIVGNLCRIRDGGAAVCSVGGDHPGPFLQVGAGQSHACGLLTTGALTCWGQDFGGSLDAPTGTFEQVDAGGGHACAIRTDDTVECWGANGGEGLDEEPSGTFSKISAGVGLNCAIRTAGTLYCWGDDRVPAPPTGTFIDVDAGVLHACAITPGMELRCWGYDLSFPITPPPPGQFLDVAVGHNFACAINTSYKVVCWGPLAPSEYIPDDIAGPRPTTTTVASTPNPSGFGASATFTATVMTGSTSAATAGSVTFIEGGTCAAPTVTHASDVTVNSSGKASFSTSTLALGAHTITACYGGATNYYASEGSTSHTVDPAITGTQVTANPTSQQYSDRVSLSATITPTSVNGAVPTGSVQFKIGGVDVGSPVTLGSDAKAALANVQVTTAAGSRIVEAVFTSTSPSFNGSTGSTTLTVTRETAAVVYSVANAAALEVSTPGGSLDANALSLSIGVGEQEPDVAVSPGTTGIGSVANAGLAVQLVPVGPGTTYTLTCTPGTVTGTEYQATRPFTCTNPASVGVNVYEVQVTITGDYYTGTYADAFTVFDPSLGFVSGGGTFLLNGDRVRFGINTKYKKSGDAAKGSLIVVRAHGDGTRTSLTSNALAGMAVGEDPSVRMGWAALNGKATYTRWDAATSSYVTVGGQSFTFYTEDRGTPGTGVDRVWIGGPALLSLPGTLATAKTNAVTLTGGNVSVPHHAK